jgi:hypothetical protein
MDEEDLAELAASRSLVDNTEELDITGGKGKGTDDAEDEESKCVVHDWVNLQPDWTLHITARWRENWKQRSYLRPLTLSVRRY